MVVGDVAVGTDVLIIGGGPGGYVAAIRAAQLGKDVTIIDQNELGGTCLQVGCIPSKALINAADLLTKISDASKMGINVQGVSLDAKKMQAWKSSIIRRLTLGVGELCKKNGITVLKGKVQFDSSTQARIETEHGANTVNFKRCIIATGSVPIIPKDFVLDGKKVVDSSGALALDEIPKTLLVLGGGYIGLEIGSAYASFGSKVTVIEGTPTLLPGTDRALVDVLSRRLNKKGVEVLLETKALAVKTTSTGVEVQVESKGAKQTLTSDVLLVAVGRKPFTQGLQLDKTGVTQDDKGFILVNEHCQTNVDNIYAIGDVAGQPMLAHKASRDGMVAAEHIAGNNSACDQITVPAVIFTDPEIAYAGLTEEQAKAKGLDVATGMFPFSASGRAMSMNESEGFIRVVAEKQSQRIIGVQMVGPHVSDLISEAVLAIEMGALAEDLSLTIHPHPTLPEALKEAVEGIFGNPIHLPPRS